MLCVISAISLPRKKNGRYLSSTHSVMLRPVRRLGSSDNPGFISTVMYRRSRSVSSSLSNTSEDSRNVREISLLVALPPRSRSSVSARLRRPGRSCLSTVATTQGMQILACPALQSPPCRSICVRAMIYPPAAVTGLLRRPGRSSAGNPLSPPTLAAGPDMQSCSRYAPRTASLCRITQDTRNPQPAPCVENALSCGYGAQRRIRRFM